MSKLHTKARGPHVSYPERCTVNDQNVNWSTPCGEYAPTQFTASVVFANGVERKGGGWAGWADPPFVPTDIMERESYEGNIQLDNNGFPLNPKGRTGMIGRGLLGKWGPNHAADPIVTRYDPNNSNQLQVAVIKRKDCGDWALPGGMVDSGESISRTLEREFQEEAGNLKGKEKEEFDSMSAELFSNGKVIYRGYVDDPRNTDNSWMETTAVHFHCNPGIAKALKLNAGDDAAQVEWMDFSDNEKMEHLYADHAIWIKKVAFAFDDGEKWKESEQKYKQEHTAKRQRRAHEDLLSFLPNRSSNE